MAESFSQWTTRLQNYVAACRATTQLPDRNTFTRVQEWQHGIVSSAIKARMREFNRRYFQEQAVVNRRWGSNNPIIVFTSDVPGLVAAREIIGTDHERLFFLLESEYEVSPCAEENKEEGFYRNFYSTIHTEEEIDPNYLDELRAKHPIPNGCTYWRHAEGDYSGSLSSRCETQLWCWDGEKPTIIPGAGIILRS